MNICSCVFFVFVFERKKKERSKKEIKTRHPHPAMIRAALFFWVCCGEGVIKKIHGKYSFGFARAADFFSLTLTVDRSFSYPPLNFRRAPHVIYSHPWSRTFQQCFLLPSVSLRVQRGLLWRPRAGNSSLTVFFFSFLPLSSFDGSYPCTNLNGWSVVNDRILAIWL